MSKGQQRPCPELNFPQVPHRALGSPQNPCHRLHRTSCLSQQGQRWPPLRACSPRSQPRPHTGWPARPAGLSWAVAVVRESSLPCSSCCQFANVSRRFKWGLFFDFHELYKHSNPPAHPSWTLPCPVQEDSDPGEGAKVHPVLANSLP